MDPRGCRRDVPAVARWQRPRAGLLTTPDSIGFPRSRHGAREVGTPKAAVSTTWRGVYAPGYRREETLHRLTFLHVVAVFGYLLMRGSSATVAFRLRREREPARIRALLDLSNAYFGATCAMLGLIVLTGIVDGVMGSFFSDGRPWLWVSIVLLVANLVAMYALATRGFSRVRRAVGLPYFDGIRAHPAVEPAGEEELAALLAAGRPWELTVIGFGGMAVIAWLMLFKPF